MEWMLMPLRRYADFQGRSRRKEYWMFTLGYAIFSAIAVTLIFASGAFSSNGFDPGNVLAIAVIVLFGIVGLGLLIPSIAVQVRRFHDQDLSGWWVLGLYVVSIIPYIGLLASIALFVFMCLPGKRGSNRFGPDPKENVAEAFA